MLMYYYYYYYTAYFVPLIYNFRLMVVVKLPEMSSSHILSEN
jgi:hypothetical protein